ncbi:hypothetical protein I4U23_015702 [Adineta vaga]|nr:hypothetical protein I4U23_015702 [Adineta vaga]
MLENNYNCSNYKIPSVYINDRLIVYALADHQHLQIYSSRLSALISKCNMTSGDDCDADDDMLCFVQSLTNVQLCENKTDLLSKNKEDIIHYLIDKQNLMVLGG